MTQHCPRDYCTYKMLLINLRAYFDERNAIIIYAQYDVLKTVLTVSVQIIKVSVVPKKNIAPQKKVMQVWNDMQMSKR